MKKIYSIYWMTQEGLAIKLFTDTIEEFGKPNVINYSHYRSGREYFDCLCCGFAIESDYLEFCYICSQRLKWNFAEMKCGKVVGNGK